MSGLTAAQAAEVDRHLAAITVIIRSMPERRNRTAAIRTVTARLDAYAFDPQCAHATGALTPTRRAVRLVAGELSRSEVLELAARRRRA
jgi:hypothetical protein